MSGQSQALVLFARQDVARGPIPVTELLADAMAMQAERTRKAYGRDLAAFASFVGAAGTDEALGKLVASSSAVANGVVLAYQAHMRQRGLARATINRRIAALRSVVKLAAAVDMTTVRLDLVKTLKVEEKTRDVRGPGIEVIRKIIAACNDHTPGGARDGALVRWLWILGLRRNEARTLRLSDCKLATEHPTVWVEQKGRDARQPVRLAEGAPEVLAPWLELRGDRPGALFCSLDRRYAGFPAVMDASAINVILRKRAEIAGFPRGKLPDGRTITPHAIRHSAISRVAREQGLVAAQAFARHESPSTTHRYLDEAEQFSMDAQALMLTAL